MLSKIIKKGTIFVFCCKKLPNYLDYLLEKERQRQILFDYKVNWIVFPIFRVVI